MVGCARRAGGVVAARASRRGCRHARIRSRPRAASTTWGTIDQALDALRGRSRTPAQPLLSHLIIGRVRLERYRSPRHRCSGARRRRGRFSRRRSARAQSTRAAGAAGRAGRCCCSSMIASAPAPSCWSRCSTRTASLAPDAHDRAVEWWAIALDAQAQAQPPDRSPAAYQRSVDADGAGAAARPGLGAAGYWLAAASRDAGDLERAWAAALAAWVRASLAPDGAAGPARRSRQARDRGHHPRPRRPDPARDNATR